MATMVETKRNKRMRSWFYQMRPFIFLIPSICFSGLAFVFSFKLVPQDAAIEKPLISIECSSFDNSNHWTNQSRYNNVVDDIAARVFKGRSRDVLHIFSASICDDSSPFSSHQSINDVSVWAARLLYLAVHEHQYGPARPEFVRQQHCSSLTMQANYECPDTKFLVVSLRKSGIGANFRLGAVPGLMAALATDRVLLLINHASPANSPSIKFLQEPWALASCPRRDAQCFFRPTTPCAITHEELAQAHELTRSEMRRVFRWGQVPVEREKDRVLVLHLPFRPQRQPENLAKILYNKSLAMIDRVGTDENTGMLQQASQLILQVPAAPKGFSYYGVGSIIFHSLLLFLLRPNESVSSQLDQTMEEMFPVDFDPDETVGLPIRATDKCGFESECLGFPQYMRSINESWTKTKRPTTVIVTTESNHVLQEQHDWAQTSSVRFLLNHKDVVQNTGFISDISASSISADAAMISALSSLKAQLRTGLVLGNCCSNFHLLLKDLISVGCGATTTAAFQCLQDHEQEEFRMCCTWDRSERCILRREHNETT